MRILMAGTAALALAASGALAQGKGNGNGNGSDKANSAAAAQGQDKGNRGGPKVDRGPNRGPSAATPGNPRDNRGQGNGKPDKRMVRSSDRGLAGPGGNGRGNDRPDVRVSYEDRRIPSGERDLRWLVQDRSRSLVQGCPPGLAKKRNGCNPPGQVKDRDQRSLFGINYLPSLFGLGYYDRRGDYYYRDGYLVRYGDSGISGWLPLLGGALGIGNVWPSGYTSYDVPDYYVDYYGLGGPDRYRYADNVIYRVDPEDAAIMSVAALITGDEFSVGQPLPRGYDVYNVPAPYRDRYYDTPDAMYRYSDGYVYRVDPETRLVAAVIDLLT